MGGDPKFPGTDQSWNSAESDVCSRIYFPKRSYTNVE